MPRKRKEETQNLVKSERKSKIPKTVDDSGQECTTYAQKLKRKKDQVGLTKKLLFVFYNHTDQDLIGTHGTLCQVKFLIKKKYQTLSESHLEKKIIFKTRANLVAKQRGGFPLQ